VKGCNGDKHKQLIEKTLTDTPLPHTTSNTDTINACSIQTPHTIHNIQIGTQTNINTYVVINNFGHENLSHITNEVLDRRLKEFHGNGIANLITDTHFNPERPENHNIRMNSKKHKTLRIKQDARWSIKSNDEVLDVLMTKYKDMFIMRLLDHEFQQSLKYETDFAQIQQDLMSIDKRRNPQNYFSTIRRIVAAIEDLEMYYLQQKNEHHEI
jgi:hypothetical protein